MMLLVVMTNTVSRGIALHSADAHTHTHTHTHTRTFTMQPGHTVITRPAQAHEGLNGAVEACWRAHCQYAQRVLLVSSMGRPRSRWQSPKKEDCD